MNDKVGIHGTSWHDHNGSDEQLRPRRLADSPHSTEDNNLWEAYYTDGFVDYTHEL